MSGKPWSGKVAVITGASRGIGAGIAECFAAQGLRLALCARSACPLADTDEVFTARTDVADADAVAQFADTAVRRFGHIDLWVNNAGLLAPIGALATVDAAAVARQLRVNVDGVFNGTRVFVRHLRQRRGREPAAQGVLVNISSGAAAHAYAGWSAYCAGKAAVERMTECVQLEEQDNGLRAYSLAPGVVDTAMQALIRSSDPADFPSLPKFAELKERQRFNSPAHVARHLLALAFDPAMAHTPVVTSVPNEHA